MNQITKRTFMYVADNGLFSYLVMIVNYKKMSLHIFLLPRLGLLI